ncbi:MAG: anaerobic ribonucleoside-triphosphate reductase activating protein [Candidatus Thiodiazotropha sp. (ex Ustalcina ferruginea)]|nr:anaerobic ribonucleoside-triphosphate reductase activating protein [Candidatus Thiodiazotropha sp. (ex Ustalcina ferruginea)]
MPYPPLQVGGLTPMTTIDYPDHLSAVIFCQGCPLRCHYCQNSALLPRHGGLNIPWEAVLDFLESRRGLLEAVVFSGGEPTLQAALQDAVKAVKAMGFLVGLHTAGIYPDRFARLLPHLDWVGLDIKAPVEDYEALTGVPGVGESAWQCARLLALSGLPHEIRTTLYPAIDTQEKKEHLSRALRSLGDINHVWQACRDHIFQSQDSISDSLN